VVDELTDQELAEIEHRVAATTPPPWYVRLLDDEFASSIMAVSTKPDQGDRAERWPDWDHEDIVAATLVQAPNRYADIGDHLWDQNAEFMGRLALLHRFDPQGNWSVEVDADQWYLLTGDQWVARSARTFCHWRSRAVASATPIMNDAKPRSLGSPRARGNLTVSFPSEMTDISVISELTV